MPHALEIEEILYNIFDLLHLFLADLAALARTCRTFMDPALDVLWETVDLSQIARCLPDASYKPDECYEFHRPLTPSEWDVLRSYTRRIRSISSLHGLYRKPFKLLDNPPTPEPLFPNLRRLYFEYTYRGVGPLIKSFAKTSPSLRELFISLDLPNGVNIMDMDIRSICQWQNLQIVRCREFSLDAITFGHLSRMPALIELSFTVSSALLDHFSPADLPISFSNLCKLHLESACLDSISHLLSQTRLPALTSLFAHTERCPSRLHLTSFLGGMQTSGLGNTVQRLVLHQDTRSGRTVVPEARSLLNYPFLQPCTAFARLRALSIDLEWNVALDDEDLLLLASAWPRLEFLYINTQWGWRTSRGVSPSGLARLLRTCPSLTHIALVLDTRTRGGSFDGEIITASLPLRPSASQSQSLSVRSNDPSFKLNVLDAFIAPASVPVIADFLVALLPRRRVSLRAWSGRDMDLAPHGSACRTLWQEVRGRVKDGVLARRV